MDVLGTIGPVPVRERHAARRLVGEAIDTIHDGIEALAAVGERGTPEFPVGFRPELAVVERQTEGACKAAVGVGLRVEHGLREEPEAEHAVPHEVVLHRPCAGTVVGETVRALRAALCGLHPLRHHVLRHLGVLLGDLIITERLREACITGKGHD